GAGRVAGPTSSLSGLADNLGKRSATADLDREADRAAVRRLAATTDFVLESFPPGELAARGLDWDTLRRQRPDLILTSITAFGQTGPRAGVKATRPTLAAPGGRRPGRARAA